MEFKAIPNIDCRVYDGAVKDELFEWIDRPSPDPKMQEMKYTFDTLFMHPKDYKTYRYENRVDI